MHGDFSRLTFDRRRHYSSVLYQQGRPSLDADSNEHAWIVQHYLRTLAADLVGPYAGPAAGAGFAVGVQTEGNRAPDLVVSPGRYYVGGILCENEDEVRYYDQPDAFFDVDSAEDRLPPPPFLVYLRVSERLVTWDLEPALRESALGPNGPDTAARTKIVWQVMASPTSLPEGGGDLGGFPLEDADGRQRFAAEWAKWEQGGQGRSPGTLMAASKQPAGSDDEVCIAAPDAGYRGLENQLYRVEVHRGSETGQPTFKWSRDNGTPVFPIESIAGADVTVATLGRDRRLGVEVGDWVEIVDDDGALRPWVDVLHQVVDVDPWERVVTLADAPTHATGRDRRRNPVLRRWDQQPRRREAGPDPADGVPITTGEWLHLEDGVVVQFGDGDFRTGDYWLIPARVATGDVEWPGGSVSPEPLPPVGIRYRYAPLAVVTSVDDGAAPVDLRNLFAHVPYL